MSPRLNSSLVIHRLAGDLGLRSSATPVQDVLSYCHRRVREFLSDYSDCASPALLLEFLANKLSTRICEVHTDAQLHELQREYVQRGERGFAILTDELADGNTYGITLKLQNRQQLWEPAYVSVIDCRGLKKQRGYHTKWHELGHLLVLTDQTRFAFRRTHDRSQPKSSEESLVDVVAGEFSFYPPMILPRVQGEVSFDKIEQIRSELTPEASQYSSILNLTKLWSSPCIWLEAKLAHKKSEQDGSQRSFAFQRRNPPALRAVYTNSNPAAKDLGMMIIPHFRVPIQSVIHRVFASELPFGEAQENLSHWTSSGGKSLSPRPVRVQAKRIGESVHALISPLSV